MLKNLSYFCDFTARILKVYKITSFSLKKFIYFFYLFILKIRRYTLTNKKALIFYKLVEYIFSNLIDEYKTACYYFN